MNSGADLSSVQESILLNLFSFECTQGGRSHPYGCKEYMRLLYEKYMKVILGQLKTGTLKPSLALSRENSESEANNSKKRKAKFIDSVMSLFSSVRLRSLTIAEEEEEHRV